VCKIVHVEISRDHEGRSRVYALLRRPDGSLVAVDYGGHRVELGRPRARLGAPSLPERLTPSALVS
jgi:hypothetical protein